MIVDYRRQHMGQHQPTYMGDAKSLGVHIMARTSPGYFTQTLWSRKLTSAPSSWGDWRLAWTLTWSRISKGASSRACWHPASPSGIGSCPQLQGSAETGGSGTAHHWHQIHYHQGHLPPVVPEKVTQHPQGPQPPSTQTVLLTIR